MSVIEIELFFYTGAPSCIYRRGLCFLHCPFYQNRADIFYLSLQLFTYASPANVRIIYFHDRPLNFYLRYRHLYFIKTIEIEICAYARIAHKPSAPVAFFAGKPNHDIFRKNRFVFDLQNCIRRRNHNRIVTLV